ncbi:unnamed protein product [Thelazia callipaeda]|uniref:Uncharacterized protein n=1 Tax=Thelazia callipaeda TaxID=103827 RepID=A0A0N5CSW8_THECL|nr:unnamed protein product [Thelazia callipaeda]
MRFTELQNLTNDVDEKKKKLREKTGKDFVITNVQFKNYVSDLRSKTQSYKQKQVEINNLKNESAILARTIHILTIQWNEFKQKIVSYLVLLFSFKEENGGQVIQVPDLSIEHELPISKPKTNDGNELRDMISKLNEQIDSKKMTIQKLKKLNAELKEELVVSNYNALKIKGLYEIDTDIHFRLIFNLNI